MTPVHLPDSPLASIKCEFQIAAPPTDFNMHQGMAALKKSANGSVTVRARKTEKRLSVNWTLDLAFSWKVSVFKKTDVRQQKIH